MVRSKIITPVVLLCLIVAGLVFALKPASEPSYEGKPLSAWLREISNPHEQRDEKGVKAINVIRAMGTNALPSLMRMLQARDSQFKDRMQATPALMQLISNDPQPPIRLYAAMT